jgi:glycosyltransferase involved in cell wall biosynthesis
MSETIGRGRGRLLFDCTHVFRHPWSNSGIQRVVRNVVRELPSLGADQECLPVAFLEGKPRKIEHLLPDDATSRRPLARWYAQAEKGYQSLWKFHASFDSGNPSLRVQIVKRMTLAVCHLFYPPLMLAKRLRNAAGLDPVEHRSSPLEMRSDDILVLLDSSWMESGFTAHLDAARVKGLKIVVVAYDLIPLRYPGFCDDFLIGSFGTWFQWALANADAFVCISDAVRADVEDEAARRLGPQAASCRGYGFFHLGSELDLKDGKSSTPQSLANVFAGPDPVCLMVSTIEPRKNHGYLLDAFEAVWEQNGQAKLCIIGKPGWKCDELLGRIRNHRESGRRLFLLESVDDDGLEYAYANASVLVFPSLAEGFGLPLVEAMQRGLPVIASDIPVFRETGGDFVAYCDIRDPASLARMILEWEKTGKVLAARDPKDWKWITWRESAQQLVEAVRASLGNVTMRGKCGVAVT